MHHWLLSSGLASLLLLSLASGSAMADNQLPIAQANPANTQTQENPTGSSVAPVHSPTNSATTPTSTDASTASPTSENQAQNTSVNQSQSTVRGYW